LRSAEPANAPTQHDTDVLSPESEFSGHAAGAGPELRRHGPPEGTADLLPGAYEQRTKQLHNARAALAEAVSTLRTELGQRREEVAALRDERDRALLDNRAVREQSAALAREAQELRPRVETLEGELRDARELAAAMRNMKVVRWTAWPRRIVLPLSRGTRMTLVPPDSGTPELSVVMVVKDAWVLIECALAALVAYTDRPFEVIIVDNRSRDATRPRLSELDNARMVLNDQNRGFDPATNQGAEHARAERLLLLLNTDTFVRPGWLEPLIETLEQSTVAAVVPRFLHLDGSLQEAGVLLARDGTVRFYGEHDDPDRLCYRFRRRVDLGSAACMLVRRSDFDRLGGFDPRYAPAYYEDADFCLQLAQSGPSGRL
jgi:Glycosyl transferase family 2